jgi:hypothetical protein
MNTFVVSSLRVARGKVTHVMVQQLVPRTEGGGGLINPREIDAAELELLVATDQVYVVNWLGGDEFDLGSRVRTSGTRFVSIGKDGVDNDDLMRLPQYSG